MATVAITLTMALMVDDSKPEPSPKENAQGNTPDKLPADKADKAAATSGISNATLKNGTGKTGNGQQRSAHSGSNLTIGNFGNPTTRTGGDNSSSVFDPSKLQPIPGNVPPQFVPKGVDPNLGFSMADLEALPEAEREMVIRSAIISRYGEDPARRKRAAEALKAQAHSL
ncbi:MAG: hypothetical protein ACK5NN_02775 [Sphingomonadaceae bacterium]